MIITIPWLKEHLKTSVKESEIIDQLTNIGLEVEGIKENFGEMGKFKIAKVLKAEKHPNADKLKICDVTIGGKEILKVVCGAPNVREGLITRSEAVKLCDEDNKIKYDTLKNFSEIIGFNLDNVLSKISSLQKLY